VNDVLGTTFSNYTGDICKFITATGHAPGYASGVKWRMPVLAEFNYYIGYYSGSTGTLNVAGTGSITTGHMFIPGTANATTKFPVSGYRKDTNSYNVSSNLYLYYLTASGRSQSYHASFVEDLIMGGGESIPIGTLAAPVRCIKY
jgi:T5SS/PEP-CTERM-associated repeat protein